MTRSKFMKILSFHGATLDTLSESYDLNIDAPAGRIFNANGCHCICVPFKNNGGQSWKTDAYKEAASLVEMGTHDCSDPDCDVCYEEKA